MSAALRKFTGDLARVICLIVVFVWACMLAGCAGNRAREFCKVASPITVHCGTGADGKKTCLAYVDDQHDYLTPETERQILNHDNTFEALCSKH